jgi:hypothetical protein
MRMSNEINVPVRPTPALELFFKHALLAYYENAVPAVDKRKALFAFAQNIPD